MYLSGVISGLTENVDYLTLRILGIRIPRCDLYHSFIAGLTTFELGSRNEYIIGQIF